MIVKGMPTAHRLALRNKVNSRIFCELEESYLPPLQELFQEIASVMSNCPKEKGRPQSHTSSGTRFASRSNQLVSVIPKEGEL